ncbi:hypothetical protein DFH09DRAFT_1327690 [Mycena vulgaris]|nr:hypothetical protein DFH09DRAFT_1327690 [Mycena vulgaris]
MAKGTPLASRMHRATRNRHVRTVVGVKLRNGSIQNQVKTLTPKQCQELHYATNLQVLDRINDLSEEKRRQFFLLREAQGFDDMDEGNSHEMTINEALTGNIEFDISHAGGEFQDQLKHEMGKARAKDTRTRTDATLRRVLGFRGQMKAITDAYIKWGATQGEYGADTPAVPPSPTSTTAGSDGVYSIKVVDMFSTYIVHVPLLTTDAFVTSSLVGRGLFPCSPFAPKVAIATRVLEMFRVARLRCPTLSVQSWVKTLCDLHGRAYIPYLSQQFTICYDLYLETLATVDARVAKALGRDAPDYRLKNCCPACTYKLEGEQQLIFSMLTTMDGNDSLKRVLRKDKTFDNEGNPTRGQSERADPRTADVGGSYFLTREKVNEWSKEVLKGLVTVPTSENPEDNGECQERWKNLNEDLTSRMWGVFDETGIFLSLCRHGFVLLVADMVRSGELAKYPLAIVDALLDAFGPDVGSGYDIGCGFGTTVRNSPMAEKAADLNFKSLVGAFHGHAHNRRCQLAFLATYVPGMGLEDLEGCERFFSKSNALARSTRYASVFHRRQTISTYLAHTDTFDTYANLSTFLVNNYMQAVEILDGEAALHVAMAQLGVQDVSEFPERLEQEKEDLNGLGKEPEEETDQMEYLNRLIKLMDKREIFDTRCAENSKSTKTTRRHAQESYDRALADVQESEAKMGIDPRWTLESKEWDDAALLVSRRRYRLSINQLEALVLKRMFELTKMNMSGTGYKMRKHIAKALQSRSQAIRNGLARYNAAAAALVPPARSLTWTEVIDYTFLSEWDLLRDPEGNAQLLPWATPAARLVLDIYFKIERAREEIERLNVEIWRLVTYIRDEKEILDSRAELMERTDPDLAYFVRQYQWKRGRFNAGHIQRLVAMQKKLGQRFTGTLQPGERIRGPIQTGRGMEGMDDDDDEAEAEELRELVERLGKEEEEDTWEDYIGEEAEDEELSEMLETVLGVASDSGVVE